MRVLALDIATHTGWAYADKGVIAGHGVLDLSKHDDEGARSNAFRSKLARALGAFSVDLVVIERPVLAKPSATTYRTNGLVWDAHAAAHAHGAQRREVTADTWRKALYGKARPAKGRALKNMAIAYARDRGVEIKSDDEAEALLILWWWFEHGAKNGAV